MRLLLSPAKALDETSAIPPFAMAAATQPVLLTKAAQVARAARTLDEPALAALMHLSPALAQRTAARFAAFTTPFTPDNARPALYTFNGDVYTGLDAPSLTPAAVGYAQERVRILSGLYGLLRPLDWMQPYRLEMGVSWSPAPGQSLAAWWRSTVSTQLAAELDGAPLVNLASQEYFSAVDVRLLGVPVIVPLFKERRGDGRLQTISFFAKKARGAMARFACEQAVRDPAQLQAFTGLGYRFDREKSTAQHWLFVRDYLGDC